MCSVPHAGLYRSVCSCYPMRSVKYKQRHFVVLVAIIHIFSFRCFFSSSRLYLYRNHKQRFIVHVECFYLRRVPDCVDSKIELQPIQNRFTLSLIGITFNENVDITQSKSSMYDRTIRSVWHPISSCFCIHCTLFPLPLLWYFCCIFAAAAAALSCCCRSMHTIRVSAVLFGLVKHTDVNIACLLI